MFWTIHSTAHSLDEPGPLTGQIIERIGLGPNNHGNFEWMGMMPHLLYERLRLGSAGSLTWVSRVMPPGRKSPDEVGYSNKWKVAASVLFQILTKWNLLFCVTLLNWALTIICAFILRAHYLKLPFAFFFWSSYLSLQGKYLGGRLGI